METVTKTQIEEFDLVCPITLRTFRDPVKASDGRTYEREAIERWIKEHGTSPFTRQPLNIDDLQSDYDKKCTVDQRPNSASSCSKIYRSSKVTPVHGGIRTVETENSPRHRQFFQHNCRLLTTILFAIAFVGCSFALFFIFRKSGSIIERKHSSELTEKSQTYCRKSCAEGNFYYESVILKVTHSGKYRFESASHIDTYGYIYNRSFNPLKPTDNLLVEDDNSGKNKQFKFKIHLKALINYILVITTNFPNVTGPFSIIAKGPRPVSFTSTTTTSSDMNSTYKISLTTNSSKYCRPTKKCQGSNNFFYEAVSFNISIDGNYRFLNNYKKRISIDVYKNNFNKANPKENLISKNDKSSEEEDSKSDFKFSTNLKYILVVSTEKPAATGTFEIVATGPSSLNFLDFNNNI